MAANGHPTVALMPLPPRHCHFICRERGVIIDLASDYMEGLVDAARESFEERIGSCLAYFYGVCKDCEGTDIKPGIR